MTTSLVGWNEMAANLASEYKRMLDVDSGWVFGTFLGRWSASSTPKLSAPSIPWGHWLDSACSQPETPKAYRKQLLAFTSFSNLSYWLNLFFKNLPLKFCGFYSHGHCGPFLEHLSYIWRVPNVESTPFFFLQEVLYNTYIHIIAPFSFLWIVQLYCFLLVSQPVLNPFR